MRLAELEPIPEMLRSTELRLQEAVEQLQCHERRNMESGSLMEGLTTKVCTHGPCQGLPRAMGGIEFHLTKLNIILK